jgi:hypothetical protein
MEKNSEVIRDNDAGGGFVNRKHYSVERSIIDTSINRPICHKMHALANQKKKKKDFKPVKNICAHLNAFHAYADDPKRSVETNHYCSQLST